MADEPKPENPQSQNSQGERAGVDLPALERTLSRAVGLLGLVALGGAILLSEGHKASSAVPLALVGVFVLAKAVVLVLGVRQRWNQTPAIALEIGAFATVGWIVREGLTSVVPVLLVAVFLAGAAFWRRRAALDDGE